MNQAPKTIAVCCNCQRATCTIGLYRCDNPGPSVLVPVAKPAQLRKFNPDPDGDMFLSWDHDCPGHGTLSWSSGSACMFCGATEVAHA